jgi:enolase
MINVLSGGAHAGALIDIQDVLVVPVGAGSFGEAIECAVRVRESAAEILAARGHGTALVADEGGLAAPLGSNREAIEVVVEAIGRAGVDAAVAIDVAATHFQHGKNYRLASEGRSLDAAGLVDELRSWCDAFPIVSIEDAVGEDDFEGWTIASERLNDVQLLGDDLFVTSVARLSSGIDENIANAVLVKPNQVGTLTEAKKVVDLASSAGYAAVLSARSGESEDAWLADLAVGWGVKQLKVGSTTRSERTAKWNRLLRIEAERTDAVFAGRNALRASR